MFKNTKPLRNLLYTMLVAVSLFSSNASFAGEKTDEVLSKTIEKGVALAEKTGNFVIEQAPELLKEFYAWQLWSNIALLLLTIVISFTLYFILKKISERDEDDTILIFNLFQILPAVFFCVSVYNIIYISVAPKLYLIDYFVK